MMKFLLKQRLLLVALSLTAITLISFASNNSPLTPNAVNSATDPYFVDYAHASGTTDILQVYGRRGIKTLTFSDDSDNSIEFEDLGQGVHDIFVDHTADIFTTKAGAIIKTVGIPYNTGSDVWSCSYLYIDYDNDNRFDVDQSIEDANNDLVVFNGYGLKHNSYTGDTAEPQYGSSYYDDINKETLPNTRNRYGSATYNLPTFKLPENMSPGYYRVRYKNDWNSTHPYGRTNSTLFATQCPDNGIEHANGVIVDFTIRIKDDEEVMGINEVGTDMTQKIDYSMPYDVYNMQGVRVGATTKGLMPGLYVVRQGGAIAKIAIR